MVGAATGAGTIAQHWGRGGSRWDWLLSGIGALIGGLIVSEWLGAAGTWGPNIDGLYVLPALGGAGFAGGLSEYGLRRLFPARELTG